MKFSQNQKLILIFLAFLVMGLFVFGFGLIFISSGSQSIFGDEKSAAEIEPLSTTFIDLPTFALPTQFPTEMPAATSSPEESLDLSVTRIVVNTPTPAIYPSITPVTVIRKIPNTPVPNPQPQNNPPPPPVNQQNSNNCAAQLSYAKSTHQDNLAKIDQIYRPLIDFYQSMIDQAVGRRDAIGVVEYQRKLKAQNQQLEAAIKAENKRYQGEVAYINSTCK